MNREELIRMAREAGFADSPEDYNPYWTADGVEDLERFAALVEAHVLAGLREKYTWGTPLLDASLLASKPGQLKDRGKE